MPSMLMSPTSGITSYVTVKVKSLSMFKSGDSFNDGCEYGNGCWNPSSSKISPSAFSITSATASPFNDSPNLRSSTFTGTCPFLNPGICTDLAYFAKSWLYSPATSACGIVTVSSTAECSIFLMFFVTFTTSYPCFIKMKIGFSSA